jgi:hypothetical protein
VSICWRLFLSAEIDIEEVLGCSKLCELRELERLFVERENVDVRLDRTFMVRDLVKPGCGAGFGWMGPRRRWVVGSIF